MFTAQGENFTVRVQALAALIQKMEPYYVNSNRNSGKELPKGLGKYFTVQNAVQPHAVVHDAKDAYPYKK